MEDFQLESPQDVGPVLLLRVHKAPLLLPVPVGAVARDAWFCRWFQLTPPRGAPLRFPCYQWLEGAGSLSLRAGAGEPGGGKARGVEGWAGVASGEEEGAAGVGAGDPGRRVEQLGRRGGCFSALLTRSCALTAKVSWADDHPILQQQRQEELQARQDSYQ